MHLLDIKFFLEGVTLSPYFWLALSFILGFGAFLGGYWFLTSQLIQGDSPLNTNGGYNTGEFIGLLFSTYCLPGFLMTLMIAVPQLVKLKSSSLIEKLVEYGLIIIVLGISAYLLSTHGPMKVWKCGILFCGYEDVNDDGYSSYSFDPFITIFNTIFVFICLFLILLFIPLLCPWLRDCYPQSSDKSSLIKHSANESGVNDQEEEEESTPLLLSTQNNNRISYVLKHKKFGTSRKHTFYLWALFIFYFPFFILIAALLPDLWLYFSTSGIKTLMTTPETDDDLTAGPVLSFIVGKSDGEYLYAKLWPDLLIYYGFIYSCSVIGLLCNKFEKLRLFMNFRPIYLPGGFRLGSWLFGLFFCSTLLSLFIYWFYAHGFDYTSMDDMSSIERVARSLGQVTNAILGLLMLPTARSSLWPQVFGFSWEAGIAFHVLLGYLFLGLVCLHATVWYVWYGTQGWFPHDVFAVQLDNSVWPSDFSVDLISVVFFITLITHGILALDRFRRSNFELFYYAHFSFLALLLAVLWHAPSAWYYLLPGLCLYGIDHALRFFSQCRLVQVSQMNYKHDIISLAYEVEYGYHKFKPLKHGLGQYVFLNVPQISLLEWHPFTISSAPGDDATTHHIRRMGSSTSSFTAKLETLVAEYVKLQKPPSALTISIEGPYGLEVDYSRYDAVLFIGGGIGVTPLHSAFRGLLKMRIASLGNSNGPLSNCCRKVELLWSARKPPLFEMFSDTWHETELTSRETGFSFNFWADAALPGQPCKFPYSIGRPDLRAKIQEFSKFGSKGLVFVCHVPPVMDEVSKLTQEFEVDLHSETFLL